MNRLFPTFSLLLIVTFLSPFGAAGKDINKISLTAQLHQGNELFSNGEYEKAIDTYQKIIRDYGNSETLLYNLANSYARNDQPGMAILYYKKALLLSPHHPDILGNLATVQSSMGLEKTKQSFREKAISYLPPDQWWILVLTLFLVLSISLCTTSVFKINDKRLSFFHAILLFLFLIAGMGAMSRTSDIEKSVVVITSQNLLVSPYSNAPVKTRISEGEEVLAGDKYHEFTQIRTAEGESGWVKNSAILPVGFSGK